MRTRAITITAVIAALAVPATALAASDTYRAYSFAQPASQGRAVEKPLDEFLATANARVVIRSDWKRLSAPAGRLKFSFRNNRSCGYTITFRVRTRAADDGSAEDYVTGALKAPSSGYVLDKGTHGAAAFRVTRLRTTDGTIKLSALYSRVLTKRDDIAPEGKVIWSDIVVSATSAKGNECHSGTYREVLGPRIGDALATAQTTLDFVRKR
jgi:hypothetical protein